MDKHYYNTFKGNGIFEDQKGIDYKQAQQINNKRIDNNQESNYTYNKNNYENDRNPNMQRRVKENYGTDENSNQNEYRNIKEGFLDKEFDEKRRKNHNYSNINNLESDQVGKAEEKKEIGGGGGGKGVVKELGEDWSPRRQKMMSMSSCLGNNQQVYTQTPHTQQQTQDITQIINQ